MQINTKTFTNSRKHISSVSTNARYMLDFRHTPSRSNCSGSLKILRRLTANFNLPVIAVAPTTHTTTIQSSSTSGLRRQALAPCAKRRANSSRPINVRKRRLQPACAIRKLVGASQELRMRKIKLPVVRKLQDSSKEVARQ